MRARWMRSAVRSAAAVLACVAAIAAPGCGKPVMMHAVSEADRAPISDVRVYRHVFGFLRLFPGRKFVVTGPAGDAEVMVGPANTNLTILRSGFEPVLVGVFERTRPALATGPGGYDHVLLYDEIRPKPDNGFELVMRPVRRVPMTLEVFDAATKAPVEGADVFGSTFLYLPQPGVEQDWGFPPLQRIATDAAGRAALDQVSGFRNRVTVRKQGFQDAVIAFEGRDIAGPREVDVQLRALQVKQVDFVVVDAKDGRPIPAAEVRLGEWRDGLPPNPNGWMKVTDAKGRTGPMPVPDIEPFLLSVKAQNHKEWRGAPVWRSLVDGQVKKLQMQRK
ncbi:MAG: carboxypeptidase regulatory-like domain-containing protein [Phycisphaerales bacterium]|nr:carboxypeptidase regulatory-like domain-containing protein [Phycisphaerales bacterium]